MVKANVELAFRQDMRVIRAEVEENSGSEADRIAAIKRRFGQWGTWVTANSGPDFKAS